MSRPLLAGAFVVALGGGCQVIASYQSFEEDSDGGGQAGGGGRLEAAEGQGAAPPASSGAASPSGSGGSGTGGTQSSGDTGGATSATSSDASTSTGVGTSAGSSTTGGGSGLGLNWRVGDSFAVARGGSDHRFASNDGGVVGTWWDEALGPVVAHFDSSGRLTSAPSPIDHLCDDLVAMGPHGFAGVSQDEGGAWISMFDPDGFLIEDVAVPRPSHAPWDVEEFPTPIDERRPLWVRWSAERLLLFDPERVAVADVDPMDRTPSAWRELPMPSTTQEYSYGQWVLDDLGESLFVYRAASDTSAHLGHLADATGHPIGGALPFEEPLNRNGFGWSSGTRRWTLVEGNVWYVVEAASGALATAVEPAFYVPGDGGSRLHGHVVATGDEVVYAACSDLQFDPAHGRCAVISADRDARWLEEIFVNWPDHEGAVAVPQVVAIGPGRLLVFESAAELYVRSLTAER